jgi:hypothetical protein
LAKKINLKKISWFHFIFGITLIIYTIQNVYEPTYNSDLVDIEVLTQSELEKDGSRSSYDFRFWTTNYECQFLVPKAGTVAGNWSKLNDLEIGTILQVKVHKSRREDLYDKSKRVPIYSIAINNNSLFTLDQFNKQEYLRNLRYKYFSYILSIMFLVHAIFRNKKWNSWLIGIIVVVIVIVRFFRIGIY